MQKALRLTEEQKFDQYISVINFTDGDGISILKKLRSFNNETPAIFSTTFHDTVHLKTVFESGGSD